MYVTRPFLILIVLDGFGCRAEREWNAVLQAKTPAFARLFRESPWTTLEASGLRVGLPEGQMGNSEVGHLNMGAGRVVDQDIVRIGKAVAQRELDRNVVLTSVVAKTRAAGRAIHLAGLLSDGGVHSLQTHLHGLVDSIERISGGGPPRVYVHAILDGRDTPPVSASRYLTELLDHLKGTPARLVSIIGRYYAMDRDRRWERIRKAYDLMTLGIGTESSNPLAALAHHYDAGVTDEFMQPIAVVEPSGAHQGKIEDGDAIIFFNFRADRMRQIVSAFGAGEIEGLERTVRPQVDVISMVEYREDYPYPVLFSPIAIRDHLGEVLSRAGLRQLRIAETEKYAHVTFFFNGGSDTASPGETRDLVPSPKVATYDLQPEMSLPELASRVVAAIDSKRHDVIILNVANPDMVGHTGVMNAAVAAVEATDRAIDQILAAVGRAGGVALITADHGNCEMMFDPLTGQPHTAHTTNPVPLILAGAGSEVRLREGGALENVGPTMLDILGIEKPGAMTASSLLMREVSQP